MVILLGRWIAARRGSSGEFRGGKGMHGWCSLVAVACSPSASSQTGRGRRASVWERDVASVLHIGEQG